MNPRHPLHKPTVRPAEPPRARSEDGATSGAVRHERSRDWRNETCDESASFERLLSPPDNFGQPTLADFSDDGFADRQEQGQGQPGGGSAMPNNRTTALWETLLQRLEERLAAMDDGPIEVQLELPNMGRISMRVVPRGDGLDIALRFAEDSAWEHCLAHQQASATWLSKQLGRLVNLTLHREVH